MTGLPFGTVEALGMEARRDWRLGVGRQSRLEPLHPRAPPRLAIFHRRRARRPPTRHGGCELVHEGTLFGPACAFLLAGQLLGAPREACPMLAGRCPWGLACPRDQPMGWISRRIAPRSPLSLVICLRALQGPPGTGGRPVGLQLLP